MGPTGRCRIDEEPMDAAGAVDAQTRPPLLAKRADAFRTAPTGINQGTFLMS